MAHYLLERYLSSSAQASLKHDDAEFITRALAGLGRLLFTLYFEEDEACMYLLEAESAEAFAGLEGLIDRISLVSLG